MKIAILKNVFLGNSVPALFSQKSYRNFIFLLAFLLFAQTGSAQIFCGGEKIIPSCMVNEAEFQCIEGDVDSPTEYGTTLLNPVDALTTPQFLLVKGIVSFTEGYTFAPGSEVVFLDSDSGFRVTDEVLLSLESSHLHGCTKLWKGVEVLEGGTLFAEDCTFEDARAAIILRRLTTIGAVGNTFSRNVCGILATVEFPIDVEMSVTLFKGGILGNTFDGADLLLETIDPSEIDPGVENELIPNITGDRPFVGIWLRNVTAITIGHLGELFSGTNDVPLNVFQNYGYDNGGCTTLSIGYMGIRSIRSNLEVRNSIFSNIGYYDPMDGSQNCGAAAIYASNFFPITPKTSVIGTKGADTDLYSFSNCYRDIYTIGSSLEVTNVTSYKAGNSISFSMQNSLQNAIDVNIKDNDITFFRSIGIEGNWFKPINVKVENNLISDNNELYDPASRVGIIIHGHDWAGKRFSGIIGNTIVSNSILFFGAFHGIILDKCPNMFVYDNTIEEVNSTESNLASFYGIINLGANPSNGMRIVANTINGSKIDYPLSSAGIRLAECSNTWLSCNITNNINTGMIFFGDCDNSVLHKNEFGFHNKGLAIGDSEFPTFVVNVIGLQKIKKNAWNIPTSPIHAYALNEISALSSVFKIHESDMGTVYWPEIRKIGDNDDMGIWFQTTQEGLPYDTDCNGNPKPPSEKDRLADSDNKIIEGTFTSALDYPALDWEARWLLADKLNRTPELLEEAVEVTQYFQNTYSDSYSTLNRIYQTYRNIWQQETPAFVQAANLEEQLKSFVSERLGLNLKFTTNPVENEILYEKMAVLDEEIENTIHSLSESMSELNTGVDQIVNDLLIALESVNTTTAYEQDMKAVIGTMLRLHFTSEVLTTEQSTEMLNIADKCRYSGGYAVALARGFYDEPIDSYEQDLDCQPVEDIGNFNAYQSPITNFNIYPNPTQSVLILEVNEKFEEGSVKIYNYLGVPLENVSFTENKIQLSVADMVAGIYFVEVETDGQKSHRRTFIKVD